MCYVSMSFTWIYPPGTDRVCHSRLKSTPTLHFAKFTLANHQLHITKIANCALLVLGIGPRGWAIHPSSKFHPRVYISFNRFKCHNVEKIEHEQKTHTTQALNRSTCCQTAVEKKL
jgi:hypothetical protein